jgi:RNA polymerase sigma-70 factor (ECF subfamily)
MEATQQTFITVYQKIDRLNNIESFKYWLYKIALNNCREEDRRRKKKHWYSIFSNDEAKMVQSGYGLPEHEYHQKEKEELVAEALKKLPDEQKTVVILKEFEGLKFREISETLNISENTAKSRLYYGLKALRIILEESELNYKSDRRDGKSGF